MRNSLINLYSPNVLLVLLGALIHVTIYLGLMHRNKNTQLESYKAKTYLLISKSKYLLITKSPRGHVQIYMEMKKKSKIVFQYKQK